MKYIEGITLSNKNYIQAWKQSKDPYGNSQLITLTHISKLLKLEKVFNNKNVKELSNFYDRVESHIRSTFNDWYSRVFGLSSPRPPALISGPHKILNSLN